MHNVIQSPIEMTLAFCLRALELVSQAGFAAAMFQVHKTTFKIRIVWISPIYLGCAQFFLAKDSKPQHWTVDAHSTAEMQAPLG